MRVQHASSESETISTGDPILAVRNLSVDYGTDELALHALDGVTLTLHRGEVLGIVGESGSGKSTLAYALTRLLRPPGRVTAGEIEYRPRNGIPVDVLRLSDSALAAIRWTELAVVLQASMDALNPVLRLSAQFDDVMVAHRKAMKPAARAARVVELLQMVGIPGDRASAYPHELSGGTRQRALIALALALDPEVIVMDEPSTALDVVLQRQIMATIMRLKEQLGFSIVFITHDVSLLMEMADRIAVMYAGKVVELADTADLSSSSRHPYSWGLLHSFPQLHAQRQRLVGIPGSPPDLRELPSGCAFHPRCSHALASCSAITPELAPATREDAGKSHEVACLLYREESLGPPNLTVLSPEGVDEVQAARSGARASQKVSDANSSPSPALEAKNLTKLFSVRGTSVGPGAGRRRTVRAVEGVSLALYPGQVTALVGESGSGKSTVARLLAQLARATDGSIELRGHTVRARGGRGLRRYVRDVQLVLQDPYSSLNPVHTVGYHLLRPLRIHGRAGRRSDTRRQLLSLLAEVGLRPPEQFAAKFPNELSGGQRQRVAVARALAAEPSVLLADEPVSMLDVSIRLGILSLLGKLVAERDLALLYVTHDIASARYFADSIVVMYAGQLVEGGPSEDVVASPAHPYTALLIKCAPDPEADTSTTRSANAVALEAGEPPSAIAPPPGCRFHPRCPHVMEVCRSLEPPATMLTEGRWVKCWLYGNAAHDEKGGNLDRASIHKVREQLSL